MKCLDMAHMVCDKYRMKQRKTISEMLRRAIRESGIPLKRIETETGVQRMSIDRFLNGKSLRLDKADILCEYFGIEISRKKTGKRK